MTVVLCPGLTWWVMAVWHVLAIVDPCQSLLLRPLHRYAVFSCAAYLGKLCSVVCCSELCYTVHWLLAVCKINLVCILFSVESALKLFGRRQFCGCLVDDVAAWCSSVDLLCVWRLQAPQLPLTFLQGDLVAVGVLSGNRNFEGRVHPNTRANYLASPPLVIAYAIAGTIRIDFEKEPLGKTVPGCLFLLLLN